MENGWYVYANGQNYGPYDQNTLIAYARSGQIRASDLAWNAQYANWVPLDQIPFLSFLRVHTQTASSSLAKSSVKNKKRVWPWMLLIGLLGFVLLVLFINPSQKDVLINQTINPSMQSQTIDTEQGLRITIPGGLLQNSKTLYIERFDVSDDEPALLETDVIYTISLGETSRFEQYLEIEFEIEELLDDDQIAPAFFDERTNRWVLLDHFELDTIENKVRIWTNHLSAWTLFRHNSKRFVYNWGLTDTFENDYFRVHYATGDTAKIGKETVPIRGMAQKITYALTEAYENYQTQGFRVPNLGSGEKPYTIYITEKIVNISFKGVDIEESDAGAMGYVLGFLYFNTHFTDHNQLYGTIGHELFHVIQNQYHNTRTMYNHLWWTEATAEYAGHVLAYPEPKSFWSSYLIKANESMRTVNSSHEYACAKFIDYMVRERNLDFMHLWEAVTVDDQWDRNLSEYFLQMEPKHWSLFDEYMRFIQWMLTNEENLDYMQSADDASPRMTDWQTNEEGLLHIDETLSLPYDESIDFFCTLPLPKTHDGRVTLSISIDMDDPHMKLDLYTGIILPTTLSHAYNIPQGGSLVHRATLGSALIPITSKFITLEPGEALLLTAYGRNESRMRVRIIEQPAALVAMWVYLGEKMPMEHTSDGYYYVRDVEYGQDYELYVGLSNLPDETQKVELYWDLSQTSFYGSETGPFTADRETLEQEGLIVFQSIVGRFRKPGLNRIVATILDATPDLSREEIESFTLFFYLATIDSVIEVSTDRQIVPNEPALTDEMLLIRGSPAEGDYRYRWDFGDGTVVETDQSKVKHTYDEPGSYEISMYLMSSLRSVDEKDQILTVATRRVTVIDKDAPAEEPTWVPGVEGMAGLWRVYLVVDRISDELQAALQQTGRTFFETTGFRIGQERTMEMVLFDEIDHYRQYYGQYFRSGAVDDIRFDGQTLFMRIGQTETTKTHFTIIFDKEDSTLAGTFQQFSNGQLQFEGRIVRADDVQPFDKQQLSDLGVGESWDGFSGGWRLTVTFDTLSSTARSHKINAGVTIEEGMVLFDGFRYMEPRVSYTYLYEEQVYRSRIGPPEQAGISYDNKTIVFRQTGFMRDVEYKVVMSLEIGSDNEHATGTVEYYIDGSLWYHGSVTGTRIMPFSRDLIESTEPLPVR